MHKETNRFMKAIKSFALTAKSCAEDIFATSRRRFSI